MRQRRHLTSAADCVPAPGLVRAELLPHRTIGSSATICDGARNDTSIRRSAQAPDAEIWARKPSEAQAFVSSTGYRAFVDYSDTECMNLTQAVVELEPLTCERKAVTIVTSFGIPRDLPTQAVVNYVDTTCTKAQPAITLFSPTACANSPTHLCAADRTQTKIDQSDDSECTGNATNTDAATR
jgi:hypothetical protein